MNYYDGVYRAAPDKTSWSAKYPSTFHQIDDNNYKLKNKRAESPKDPTEELE